MGCVVEYAEAERSSAATGIITARQPQPPGETYPILDPQLLVIKQERARPSPHTSTDMGCPAGTTSSIYTTSAL